MVVEEHTDESEAEYLQADLSDIGTLIRDTQTGRFIAGQSGNPAGRPPRGLSFAELANRRPSHRKLAVVLAQERKAIAKGDTRAAEWLRDTAEGKPATRIIVTQTDAESPLVSALQRIASRIAQAEGVTIEGESRLIEQGDENSGVSEDR